VSAFVQGGTVSLNGIQVHAQPHLVQLCSAINDFGVDPSVISSHFLELLIPFNTINFIPRSPAPALVPAVSPAAVPTQFGTPNEHANADGEVLFTLAQRNAMRDVNLLVDLEASWTRKGVQTTFYLAPEVRVKTNAKYGRVRLLLVSQTDKNGNRKLMFGLLDAFSSNSL
jgi:hypothetical protein